MNMCVYVFVCVCVFEKRLVTFSTQTYTLPLPRYSSGSSRKSQFPEFIGELTLKVARESLIGTTYQGIDFVVAPRRIEGGPFHRHATVD